jgi:hypothetical protein
MNAAEKFAQDSFIAQMAATLLAGEFSREGECGGLPYGMEPHTDRQREKYAADAVAQARAIYNAATDARIKGDTQ